eukprot:gb/GFBE01024624.1/.p1 GENE.gb/GFBE01024624.1/~~gb/GFBE01024624.1/.p1  ORF type:complete len:364 (+),score=110.14 gb/GFBE01024624.1/:1-1092(+)
MARFTLLASVTALASSKTVIKVGQDVDWPPYAFKDENGTLQGFGKDMAEGLTALCSADLEFQVVQANWSDCWSSANGGSVGAKLLDGTLDACTTYTHTRGVRDSLLEFSNAMLQDNRPAGLISLLKDGKPMVDGMDDLSGKKVIDVGGWAPTADTIVDVENKCTSSKYSTNLTMVVPSEDGNDAAMKLLRDGGGDVMYLYADQAEKYQCAENETKDAWDCKLWAGFGTEYAYVQTGKFGYALNGTTLVMAKKGSGVAAVVDGCLAQFMETKEYYDVCVKHGLVETCYKNSFFPVSNTEDPAYIKETDEHTTGCSDGYCSCSVEAYVEVTTSVEVTTTEKTTISSALSMTLSSLVVLPFAGLFA